MSNPKDYRQELKEIIDSGKNDSYRKIAHATFAVKTSDMSGNEIYGIQYHKTVIFGIRESGEFFFNNGGYFTATTKKRINDALRKCGFNSFISQKKFRWYLCSIDGSETLQFARTAFMLFDVDNSFTPSSPSECWAQSLDIKI